MTGKQTGFLLNDIQKKMIRLRVPSLLFVYLALLIVLALGMVFFWNERKTEHCPKRIKGSLCGCGQVWAGGDDPVLHQWKLWRKKSLMNAAKLRTRSKDDQLTIFVKS